MTISQNDFFTKMYASIDSHVLRRTEGRGHMPFETFQKFTLDIQAVYREYCGEIPKEVQIACGFGNAVMAPDMLERCKILKDVAILGGGVAGMAAIVGGIGLALGWGAGIIQVVTAFFVGAPLLGPIGWIAAGTMLMVIAAYFYFSDEKPEVLTSKAIQAIKNALKESEKDIWFKYSDAIQKNYSKMEGSNAA